MEMSESAGIGFSTWCSTARRSAPPDTAMVDGERSVERVRRSIPRQGIRRSRHRPSGMPCLWPYPFDLIVKMLFGCGLRLFECLQLWGRDFNFDAGILTIHGKGKKDRTVPLPESVIDELHWQIQRVTELHEKDLATGYAGVFLDDAVERKFPKAPKELLHQWFFPQQKLTLVEEAVELRRYHIHESLLQRALYCSDFDAVESFSTTIAEHQPRSNSSGMRVSVH